jgi:hypothetical protein
MEVKVKKRTKSSSPIKMQNLKWQFKIQNLLIILIISFIFVPTVVFGAILYLEPEDGQYYLEDVFVVEIKINTEGEEINAIKVDLAFSQDVLEIKDFSQGNSILALWPEGPSFSNQTGKIHFIGGIPGGYSVEDGLLGKIIFRARETTQNGRRNYAKVEFLESSQVLLNDGLATPAKLTMKEAIFNILPEKLEVPGDQWREELEKDDVRPEPFEIIIYQDPTIFEGKYFIIFSTVDKQTGIDYYEILEADKRGYRRGTTQKAEWEKGESPYLLEDQSLKSIIKVKVVDKAGNERIVEYLPSEKITWKYWLLWAIIILLLLGVMFWLWKEYTKKH